MECTCATVIIAGGLVVKTLRDRRCPEHGDDARAQEVVNALKTFKTLAEMGKRETKMEETKHTPGPWEARNWSCHAPTTVMSGDHNIVAECGGNGERYEAGVVEANARLIAAAPELLAACRAMMDATYGGGVAACLRSFGIARAAIAKAEGSSD